MADNKEIDIAAIFDLPPEKVIEYLEAQGYVITQNWYDLWEQCQQRAFTIAGIMNEDILADAKDIIDKGVSEGKTFNSVKNEFQARMQAKGWNPSVSRLKMIYRINSDVAYSVGRYQEQESIKDFAPYWQYSAVMDMNTRPAHAAMNGKVFKADDPIWNYFYPPNGYNCRCTVRSYTQSRLDRKGLTVEDSTGKLEDAEIEVGGKTFKTKAYEGNKIDAGWAYNPGKDFTKIPKD